MTIAHQEAACLQATPPPTASRGQISLEPATAYEVVTRQMVLDIVEDLREIKARLNGILFMVAGAVVLEVITRMMGSG